MYSPDTCPAGWAARAQEGRAINAPARINDDAAPFTFICGYLPWLAERPISTSHLFSHSSVLLSNSHFLFRFWQAKIQTKNHYVVSQHERPGRHFSVLAKPPSGPTSDCVCAHQKGPVGIDRAFSSAEIMSTLVAGTPLPS